MNNKELTDCYKILELFKNDDLISVHYIEKKLNFDKSYISSLIDEILVPKNFLQYPDEQNGIILKATKYTNHFISSLKLEKIKKEENIQAKNTKREVFLNKVKSVIVIPAFLISLISLGWNFYNYYNNIDDKDSKDKIEQINNIQNEQTKSK